MALRGHSTSSLGPMTSAAAKFTQSLGAEVAAQLGNGYKFLKSRAEVRAESPEAHNVIILSVAAKYSPFVSVAFYFGRNYSLVRKMEQRHALCQFPYHIQQFSMNRNAMRDVAFHGPFQWSVNIQEPLGTLPTEITKAISGLADPFFNRFASLVTARDALASDDPWCFGGRGFWRQLLHVDPALGDLAHFFLRVVFQAYGVR